MPKLPAIHPQKLAKVLEKKGFVLDRIRGSHYVYVHPETKVTISLPVHTKEIKKGILLDLMKQAGISREELIDLL
jgi:predicted RNA binding protein YcfA (HicA-like mRNA interferase family)